MNKLDTTPLQYALILGSMIATLLGAEIIAQQDVSRLEPTILLEVEYENGHRWLIVEQNNALVAQLTIPNPIANSRSSG